MLLFADKVFRPIYARFITNICSICVTATTQTPLPSLNIIPMFQLVQFVIDIYLRMLRFSILDAMSANRVAFEFINSTLKIIHHIYQIMYNRTYLSFSFYQLWNYLFYPVSVYHRLFCLSCYLQISGRSMNIKEEYYL